MNRSPNTSYEQIALALSKQQIDAALELLAAEFRRTKQYTEWFEVLKMQARRQVGLEPVRTDRDQTEDATAREKLEPLLYQACAQVGEQLFRDGHAGWAWKYFQLVGDRPRAAEWLRQIPATSANAHELIDVAWSAGVAPDYGIELILDYRGTCDAITAIDQQVHLFAPSVRDAIAQRLVRHLYGELTANVAAAIEHRQGQALRETKLTAIIAERPWLFADNAYHVDPSHLAATVRIGRMTTSRESLEQARELCAYGQRLDPSLVGSGDPPFEELFIAHDKYFAAAMGRGVEQVLAYFQSKLPQATSPGETFDPTAEVIVDLLCRHARWPEALHLSLEWLGGHEGHQGLVPSAFEIARRGGQESLLAQWYRDRDNLLMFAMATIAQEKQRGQDSLFTSSRSK